MKTSKASAFFALTFLLFAAFSCTLTDYADSDTLIVSAREAVKKIEEGYILLDAQKATSYGKRHIEGAVNIERKAIMIKEPVANSLATAEIVSQAAEAAGLTESSNILIYDDNNNMDATRLYWTLKIWGHEGDIRVVSGGFKALQAAGLAITDQAAPVRKTTYHAKALNKSMIATKEEILALLDNPSPDTILIDVRTDEEYNAGSIPGSIHINHERNMFINDEKGSTFRPVSHIRVLYKELGIMPEDEIIMYCKSSVRAANTYAALYNAGYRNLKIYDGAWLEWSSEKLPVFKTEVKAQTSTSQTDNS